MWPTSKGDRILRGYEAAIFQDALSSLTLLMLADDFTTGVPLFDRLSLPEKFAVLEQVAVGLLEMESPLVKATAVLEAAIGAVYGMLRLDVGVEIDEGIDTSYRSLIVNALGDAKDTDMPNVHSKDISVWNESIELLLDRIVWDRDWDEEFVKPDDSPDDAQEARQFYGIDDEYYSAVAPDPNPEQLQRIENNLKRLCGEEAFRLP